MIARTVSLRGTIELLNGKPFLYPLSGGPAVDLTEELKRFNKEDIRVEITSA